MTRIYQLTDLLDRGVILADGAMGTQLIARGTDPGAIAQQNILKPEVIRSIHLEYVLAGAQLIETNTFGANRLRLKETGLEEHLVEINRAGVRLARDAARTARENVFVAGSVGPLGALVKPYGNLTLADLAEAYVEQISILVDEGVDAIIIETHPSLLEALEAVRAARNVSPTIPVIAQMTFMEDGRSKFGDDLRRSLEALAAADADVVGVNCSGPQMTFDFIEAFLRSTDLRVSVMPNAGLPQSIGGRQIYLSSPDYLQEYAKRFVEAGANLIGGCCGTTPEHIRAMAEAVRGQAPRRVRDRSVAVVLDRSAELLNPAEPAAPLEDRFLARLGREFVLTAEAAPPRGLDCTASIEVAQTLKGLGVDAINVSENPLARVRMSCLALAHLIQSRAGIEVVLHFSCRDRNLPNLQSDLLGAAALGIRHILALTGDPSAVGELPRPTSAFEVNATGLVRIIHGFNHGFTLTGTEIGRPTSFRVGVAVNPAAPDLEAEVAKLEERVEAGAHFAQTQPVFDPDLFERFLARIQAIRIPLIVSVLPLTSARHAEFLHNEIPGIVSPEAVRNRMKAANGDPRKEGLQIAREFIERVRPLVSGAHIIPHSDHVASVTGLI
ncbi:MAG: bifunctional homocysteine S-methyltransferase/methylenetetrahydrofolate reductase [Acidobacteria bacterium]|nr:bifunctional homocysteine S-methyltransferase/methylenetetrahydrofolate reductase [Acidobacteriota bacterium]